MLMQPQGMGRSNQPDNELCVHDVCTHIHLRTRIHTRAHTHTRRACLLPPSCLQLDRAVRVGSVARYPLAGHPRPGKARQGRAQQRRQQRVKQVCNHRHGAAALSLRVEGVGRPAGCQGGPFCCLSSCAICSPYGHLWPR